MDYLREHLGLPVVPEAALGLDYKIFFIYRTCMRRAPARPVCASLCDSDALFQRSHLKLHTSHCTLHTSHVTLRTYTSHPILHLISSHLSSSHLIPSLLICPRSSSQLFLFHPSTAQSNFFTHRKLLHTASVYTQQSFTQRNFYTQQAFTEKPLDTHVFAHGSFYMETFTHRSSYTEPLTY